MLEFFIYYPLCEFVERYCINLFFSRNILVSPFMVIESFAGYSSLGWHLCSLRVCMMFAQDLLDFIVSGEKSGVILIGLPVYDFFFIYFIYLSTLLQTSDTPEEGIRSHYRLL